ncbi:PepSY domain-containing protein [Parathalassolituus penaei]|uniref:PepSY domain-containing protein n=1 Tax=Parathalassolituus penaei TaxID=2997323 RepID=A0A9X3IRH9_9GAMM|nr:PepSY domain-containing protein [Parathalassolituus penaei]MCY0965242.1 PepSY domain-containing protein [Parathalassolituus penaei]
MNIRRLLAVVLTALMTISSVSVQASETPDPRQIKRWVDDGTILPLDEVLRRQKLPGRVLDVDLEYEDDVLVYEVKWLDDSGHRHKLFLDARTGQRIDWRHREHDHEHKRDNNGERRPQP